MECSSRLLTKQFPRVHGQDIPPPTFEVGYDWTSQFLVDFQWNALYFVTMSLDAPILLICGGEGELQSIDLIRSPQIKI